MVAENVPTLSEELPHTKNNINGHDDSCGSEGEEEMKKLSTTKTSPTTTTTATFTITSSITTEEEDMEPCGNGSCVDKERRFVWFQKEEEQKLRAEAATKQQHYEYNSNGGSNNNNNVHNNMGPASSRVDKSKDFKDKVRAGAGGAKGKTGSTDFTRGKNAFVRPCTVGWKSQNQPLMKGGGGRTPRQKG